MIDEKKNESSVKLENQQLTDQDMEIVAYYLLRKNNVRKFAHFNRSEKLEQNSASRVFTEGPSIAITIVSFGFLTGRCLIIQIPILSVPYFRT